MDAESDDEIINEVELTFVPRPQTLADLGITEDDFAAALVAALDEREALAGRDDISDDEIPPLEEMPLNIGGVTYKLEDLAEVDIRGDVA